MSSWPGGLEGRGVVWDSRSRKKEGISKVSKGEGKERGKGGLPEGTTGWFLSFFSVCGNAQSEKRRQLLSSLFVFNYGRGLQQLWVVVTWKKLSKGHVHHKTSSAYQV